MKKIILTAGLACVMAFSLAACGGGSSSTASSGAAGTSAGGSSEAAASTSASAETKEETAAAEETTETAAEETTEAAAPAAAGETYDVGEFTVDVPSGWMVMEQKDMLADADENGEYPTSTTSIGLIKGGESEWDAFSKPTIYIYKYEGDAASQAETTAIFYDETEDLDVTINGVACPAFEAKSAGLSDDGEMYVYDIVFIPVDEEVFFQVNVPVDMIDFEGVNIDDADVQAILGSLALK